MFETDDDARRRAPRPLPGWYTPEREELWTVERGIVEATFYVRDGYSEADLEHIWHGRQLKARYRASAADRRSADEATNPLLSELRKAQERLKSARARVKKARERLERAESDLGSSDFLAASRAQVHAPECRQWLTECGTSLARAEADVLRLESLTREPF